MKLKNNRKLEVAAKIIVMGIGFGTAAGFFVTEQVFEAVIIYLVTAIWCEIAIDMGGDSE